MATKTMRMNSGGRETKVPSVFERLSTQKVPHASPQRNLKPLHISQEPKKPLKSVPLSSTKRKSGSLSSPKGPSQAPVRRGIRETKRSQSKKEDASIFDSYQEKALMEKIPETIGKDLKDAKVQHEIVQLENILNQTEKSGSPCADNDTKGTLIISTLIPSGVNCQSDSNSETPASVSSDDFTTPHRAPSDLVSGDVSIERMVPQIASCPNFLGCKDKQKLERQNSRLKETSVSREKALNEDSSRDSSKKSESQVKKISPKRVVRDDDKDICEDADDEDDEFYNVRVQTRLVSYENSTLVIRNTSKQTERGEASPCGSENSDPPQPPTSSLPNSLSCPGSLYRSGQSSSSEGSNAPPAGRLRGVRSRLGNLVTKGRSLLEEAKYSSYVPDMKSSLAKFQDVTRLSLRMLSSPMDALALTPAGDCTTKQHTDIGVSSSSSASERQLTSPSTSSDSGVCESQPGEVQEAGEDVVCLPSTGDTVEVEDEGTAEDFSKFFSSCCCSESQGVAPPVGGVACSCLTEPVLPTEIRDLLDADHARMWWTITGNFGNILPIDWSKTYTRQKYLPVLNLNEAKKSSTDGTGDSVTPSPREEDDEEVAQDLDLHQLILAGAQQESEPVKSAEEVIKEIDDIMQEVSSSEDEGIDAFSSDSKASSKSELQRLPPPLYHDKLKDLSVNDLNETLMEMEVVIRRYSETLIAQLAHRDELEYEKELKNTFISLILQVQTKRRDFNVEKKKIKKPLGPNGIDHKYLTTVIPYDVGHGPPDNETIQILIKILTAITEDSPTVPTLLTDYILKVLCPS